MEDFLIKVFGWALTIVLSVGLIGLVIWMLRGLGALCKSPQRVKVYYDDNDHSKGYYYVAKPGDTYPVGYPKERIIKNMKEYERLMQEQKEKRNKAYHNKGYRHPRYRPQWLQILLMTPTEYMQYRRRRKEGKQRVK